MTELFLHMGYEGILNKPEVNRAFYDLKPGKYLVTIKSVQKRSLSQNAYYWGVVVPLIRRALYNAGFDDITENDEAHEIMKALFLKRTRVSKRTGDMLEVTGSSANLSTVEFIDYLDRISKWSAEYLGLKIPSPNEPMAELEDYVQKEIHY